MVQLLDGKSVSKKILNKVKTSVEQADFPVKLATIYDQSDAGSSMYVAMKIRRAKQVGIASEEFKIDDSWTTASLLALVKRLNGDPTISGILVQSPLPASINESDIFNAIAIEKDVDGLSALNQGLLFEDASQNYVIPATPAGVIKLLENYDFDFAGKNALVIGRSVLFGRPMSIALTNHDMTVSLAHSKTSRETLQRLAESADLIVVAVGKANWFDLSNLKSSAVVIDVGANKVDKKAVGDVDFEKTAAQVAQITPVPGGVGPMTIATLIQHTFLLAALQQKGEVI
ncbi:bifunctional 5,10-methylenetetrahydrofolate dehydrogenase/5,10-methenyltetrahydrofolate cyclohydrolase [Oenococcus kitaharae]|uniref:Bifunctional protein FolD n=1 Tax=Oenococcus kitaharae DSM 17330 TaxID=1045004 RepID=G9WG04_9LACO|nr:bifunctional 5,10-methylenetetrahydrofolate dehydrogenase/5,10-methenyltetrahydrofolate cyclohydrolase [Oenococcus kitaharae]EHN59582.1 Methylenetetrahydrofolate dehydrogenase (NADP+) [Oenococcus kitaharae DSM 17330]OEY83430.1 methenyltetrahydrofolate cyclohydrolase [Oenococcus kitaharae]OEY85229.1 methenyltetrahydrofolate cyclohydrolase [Oenococcus kitaharae]OEY86083.1 methenyltetrahydrofolate cyclohydrolase [Oenococcus kitaharae]